MQPRTQHPNHFVRRIAGRSPDYGDTVVLILVGKYDFGCRYQTRALLRRFAGAHHLVFDFSEVPYVDEAIVAELARACTARILHGRDPIVIVTPRGHRFGGRDTCLEVAADLADVACCRTPDIVFECVLAATHRRQTYAMRSVS